MWCLFSTDTEWVSLNVFSVSSWELYLVMIRCLSDSLQVWAHISNRNQNIQGIQTIENTIDQLDGKTHQGWNNVVRHSFLRIFLLNNFDFLCNGVGNFRIVFERKKQPVPLPIDSKCNSDWWHRRHATTHWWSLLFLQTAQWIVQNIVIHPLVARQISRVWTLFFVHSIEWSIDEYV